MGHACGHTEIDTDSPRGKKHARVLKAIFAINATMAVVEGVTGYLAGSKAMLADTMDMASDAVGAGSSLFVRKRSKRWQAGVALAKAAVMGALGVGVLASAVFAIFNPVMPVIATMGIVGGLALAANTACVLMIYPYRNDNINMKSTLMCTRNDVISNVGVLVAASLSHFLVSPIPDIVVGVAISGLFIKSAVGIAKESIAILKEPKEACEDGASTAKLQNKPTPKAVLQFKILGTVFNRKAKTEAPVTVKNSAVITANDGLAPAI